MRLMHHRPFPWPFYALTDVAEGPARCRAGGSAGAPRLRRPRLLPASDQPPATGGYLIPGQDPVRLPGAGESEWVSLVKLLNILQALRSLSKLTPAHRDPG